VILYVWPFGTVYDLLVHFYFKVLVSRTKKNLATLLRTAAASSIKSEAVIHRLRPQ
jgi:hypothetical protein